LAARLREVREGVRVRKEREVGRVGRDGGGVDRVLEERVRV